MKNDFFEELVVVKRSGQRVNFNGYKIVVAIKKAFDNTCEKPNEKKINEVYEEVLQFIEKEYVDRKTINVEDIQDIIENKLKEKHLDDIYLAFNEYRMKRAASRKVFTIKQQHKFTRSMELLFDEKYLKLDNSIKPQEMLKRCGRIVCDGLTKAYILDNKYLRSHEEGNIYINDLQNFSLGIVSHVHLDLQDFFSSNEIDDLLQHILNVEEETSGEINIASFDKLLSKWFVKTFKTYYKDYLTKYLKITGFMEYLNIKKIYELIDKETISNFKLVFNQFIYNNYLKNIFDSVYNDSMDKTKTKLKLKLTKLLLDLNKKPTKRICSFSFGTSESEIGILINNIILDVLNQLEFLNNIVFIFKLNENYDIYEEKLTDLILNKNICLANIATSYNKDVNEVEYFSNGVRIFENTNSIEKISNGRLIVSTVSIDMARIALKNEQHDIAIFYKDLDELLEFIKNALILMFETVGNKNKENYDYLFMNNIYDDEKLEIGQKIRKVIKNGNLNIGLVGLKECIKVLSDDECQQYNLLIDILNHINLKCQTFKNETRLNFNICEPIDYLPRKELLTLDKAVYGIRKRILDKDNYDLICNLDFVKKDSKKLAFVQNQILGGCCINCSKTSEKKVADFIKEIIKNDIGFVKFNPGKKE